MDGFSSKTNPDPFNFGIKDTSTANVSFGGEGESPYYDGPLPDITLKNVIIHGVKTNVKRILYIVIGVIQVNYLPLLSSILFCTTIIYEFKIIVIFNS